MSVGATLELLVPRFCFQPPLMLMSELHGIWSTTTLAGHDCYLYEPPTPNPHGHTVLFLHGVHLGKLSDQPAFGRQFDRHGLRVICPVTQRSWWTDRICREFSTDISPEQYVLQKVMPYIAERWGAQPTQIGLLGTSMGGQGALRLAYRYPDKFPVAAAISPAVDYQVRMDTGEDETLDEMYNDPEEARQDTALLHVHPLNWPRHQFFCCDPTDEWWNSADRLRMKLGSLGIPFECDLETIAGGHGVSYYGHMAERAVEFLATRLEQERLRVPMS